ncbi:MAG: hypothetical protein ACK4J0_01015 [Candidatus Anstonellaceae archaeon]
MKKIKKINPNIFLTLVWIILSFTIYSFAFDIQNPNQYKSFVVLDASELFSSGILKAKASYIKVETEEKNEKGFSTLEEKRTILPAAGAYVSFYINNQPITDKDGNVNCFRLKTDKDGIATCKQALYFNNPFQDNSQKQPKVLKVLEYDGAMIIEAKLEASDQLLEIRPSLSEPILISAKKSNSDAFLMSLKTLISSQSNLLVCLPLVMLTGIFIATMFYQGRSPFSVFDITVPNLPTIGTAKVKTAYVPANLSIMRKAVIFHTRRLEYLLRISKRFLKNNPEDLKTINDLLNRLATKKSLSIEEYKNMSNRIIEINAPAWLKRAISNSFALWQTLIAQLEAVAAGRTGPLERRGLLYKTTSEIGKGLAYITSKAPWLRYVDKLPYVQRVRMTITNWIASRETSIYYRRELYKSLFANTVGKIGPFREAFPESRAENKMIGWIPNIINEMRLAMYTYGDAISKNYIRMLLGSIGIGVNKEGKIKISTKTMEVLERLLNQAREEARKYLETGKKSLENERYQDERYLKIYTNYYFIFGLLDYIKENNIKLVLADGRTVERKEEILAYLNLIRQDMYRILSAIENDRKHVLEVARTHSLKEDGTPNLSIKGLDPNIMYANYNSVLNIIKRNINTFESGQNPLNLVGISLVQFFERLMRKDGYSGQNLLIEIRKKIEDEGLVALFISYLLGERSKTHSTLYETLQNLTIGQIQKNAGFVTGTEFIVRNYTTPHFAKKYPLELELEKDLILRISDYTTYLYGGGKLDVFAQSQNQINKTLATYNALKATIGFFLPGATWNAKDFQLWLERGVLFSDTKKAIFINNAKMQLTPLPTGFEWDKEGYITKAFLKEMTHRDQRFISYEVGKLAPVLFGSDYAERLVGAKQLFQTRSGVFKIGTPTDIETFRLLNLLSEEAKKFLLTKQVDLDLIMNPQGVRPSKEVIFQNLQKIGEQLNTRMKLIPAGYIMSGGGENVSLNWFTKSYYLIGSGIENFMMGMSAGEMSRRLQEWYTAQAYARMVFYNMSENYSNKVYDIPQEELESYSIKDVKKYQKALKNLLDYGRFGLGGAASFYNVAEQTVMRDPRITYGSGYGLDPAVMSGYPTGQYFPEHPRLYSFYEGIPGSKLGYPFWVISYHLGRAFAVLNRPFFTNMVGYTTVYRMDPEVGYPYGHHEKPSFFQSLRSLLNPFYSFDVLRLAKDFPLLSIGIKPKEKDIFAFMDKYSIRNVVARAYRGEEIGGWLEKKVFRDPYYVIENRTGRDITTAGGLHRPWELTKPWEVGSVVQRTDVPGKIYYDWEGRKHLYPFSAFNLTHPIKGGSLEKLAMVSGPNRLDLLMAGEKQRYREDFNIGTDYQLDSIREIYNINTSLIAEFNKIQTTVQSFGLLNSPFTFPLAPAPVLIWQMIKKTRFFRNQPWNALPPEHYPKGELTETEIQREREMLRAQQEARAISAPYYMCPTHQINIPIGAHCPICYSSEEARAQKDKNLGKVLKGKWYTMRNTLVGIGKGLTGPLMADHFFNSVYCPIHHIPYEKGLSCPICTSTALRENLDMGEKDIKRYLKEIEKQRKRAMKKLSGEELENELRRLNEQKRTISNMLGIYLDYSESYKSVSDLMKLVKGYVQENIYR